MKHLMQRGRNRTYYYCRRVPKDLSETLNKSKIVESLRTTVYRDAVVKAKALDLEYEKQWHHLRNAGEQTRHEIDWKVKRRAATALRGLNAHPSQEPKFSDFYSGPSGNTKADLHAFTAAFFDWYNARSDAADLMTEAISSEIDPKTGERVLDKGSMPFANAFFDQLEGTESLPETPTWAEAFDLYMKEIRKKKPKTAKQEAARAKREPLYAKRVAEFLGKGDVKAGWARPLNEIARTDTVDFHDWYFATYPNNLASSWNKVAGSGHKVFKTATNLLGLQLLNPFAGLTVPENNEDTRREFTPKEFALCRDAIARWKNSNPEWYLISALMLETGCRTSCAWGLTFGDLNLGSKHSIRHIWFRNNHIRALDKGYHERPMVILEPLLSDLRAWAESFTSPQPSDPLFPAAVSQSNSTDWVSHPQRKLLRELGIKPPEGEETPPTVVWYSARHTFATRAAQTDVRPGLRQYLIGQQSNETTAIHQRYLGQEPLTEIRDALLKINEVKDWGYSWSPDEAF